MRLFIAEKPELAKAVAQAIGHGKACDGYIDCGDDKITWCFGHMLKLYDPEDYDAMYKRWSMEQLPIIHRPWKKKIITDKKKQVSVIQSLLKKADEVVHTGDPDEEGQLLIDELLDYLNNNKPVKRLLINDNNIQVVKKSLTRLRDNKEFKGLSNSALARSVADQLYGYNLTRLYTLAAQRKGYQKTVLSVGRVQTPILGLIVRRDRENASHQKSFYYIVEGHFLIKDIAIRASYETVLEDETDDNNRLINKDQAQAIAQMNNQQSVILDNIETSIKKQQPPLPYNLLKLQADAGRKYNLKPDQVLEITQNLREKHKLITYNRSDCQYLSEEQHSDAQGVLKAIGLTAQVLEKATQYANPSLKSRAFNSKKVSAHHGIIPTQTQGDFSKLTDSEQKIYLLIARAYIAQFFNVHEYKQTQITIAGQNHLINGNPCLFKTTSNRTVNPGWLVLYKNDEDNEEVMLNAENAQDYNGLEKGDQGECTKANSIEKETQPPALYSFATLLNDLTRIAKYVQNPEIKKTLLAKDKEKAGEHGGIGTPATRSAIIKNLFNRGFLIEKGKKIISTDLGKQFFDALPEQATSPDITALWHEKQQQIINNQLTVDGFVDEVMHYITDEVDQVKKNGVAISISKTTDQPVIECPECKNALIRRKGKNGYFWGCSNYPHCTAIFKDVKSKPLLEKIVKPSVSTEFFCTECKKGLIKRKGKNGYFWGCSGYPTCKSTYEDNDSKPLLTQSA